MNALAPSDLIGRGLYPLGEAAKIVQLPVRTVRSWALGNRYRYHGETRQSAGLVPMELPELAGARDITFSELLTLRLVRSFRRAGLGLPTIKRVAEKAAAEYGGHTPLITKRFRTDGRRIFLELRQEAPENEESAPSCQELWLIDFLSGQTQFAEVVEPSLFRNLEWADDIQASRWWPLGQEAGVVLDPAVIFGAPRLADTSLSTEAVARAVKAEGGGEAAIEAVAEWFGIREPQIKQALAFETEWLNAA